jgi:hypothetical protein
MHSTAVLLVIFAAMFPSVLIAICLPFLPRLLSGAEEKEHARRLADARMNARLLRFNL